MKQRIGFLYLKTGGGHVSGANALVTRLKEKHPDNAEYIPQNGFKSTNWVARIFFEKGYLATSNYFEPGYVAFYQLTKSKTVLTFCAWLLRPFIVKNLVTFLKAEKITKLVCLHEILIPLARIAIDRVNPNIPLISIVMDPFTAHPSWFYVKDTELIVFSRKLQKEAISHYGFKPERVHQFPIMLSRNFDRRYTPDEKITAKKKHGIPLDKKIVLVVGGGEGLKSTLAIVNAFIFQRCPAHLIVICGKNKVLKTQLEILLKTTNISNIQVFGFVSFMPDLINVSDCVITKGGPATVMETLSAGKPLILASYVRGQEFGNMLYVVNNNLGWYIPKPRKIIKKVKEIIADDSVLSSIEQKIDTMHIQNGLEPIADFIYRFPEVQS
ncbi:glycosyltransferase [Treponema sp. OMZ 857]|uniref:glycosyltransferase n=1 Tax=Treponema sp. OMZ 857 TaxID=1643513 RepID=UPI0020A5F339|nr:glycosyltransferase [Treponema sp. OMZ 857]UTC42872.1 glycosyltransferase [Treponema sp. OMZ 857]